MKISTIICLLLLLSLGTSTAQDSKVLLSPQFSSGIAFGHFMDLEKRDLVKKRGFINGGVFLLGIEKNKRLRLGLNLSYTSQHFTPETTLSGFSGSWEDKNGTNNVSLSNATILSVKLTSINLGINIQNRLGRKGNFKLWLSNMIGTETIIQKDFEVFGSGFILLDGEDTFRNIINSNTSFDYKKSNVASFFFETGFQIEYQVLINMDIFLRPQIRVWEHREEDFFGFEGSNSFTENFPEDSLWFSGMSFNIGLNFRI